MTEEVVVEETVVEEVVVEETVVEEVVVEETVVEETVVEAAVVSEEIMEEAIATEDVVVVIDESIIQNKCTNQNCQCGPSCNCINCNCNNNSENITISVDETAIPNIIFIVPYRDREKQYDFYSKHMVSVLEDVTSNSYKILYIHQNDTRSFNRGAIKNIGFIIVKNMYPDDYQNITLVFNDIDIMPYTKNFFNYATIPGVVKHFYGFTFTLGGIVSINAKDFEIINGFPNFWAWGFEDNMLQDRVIKNGIKIDRSQFYPILDKNVLHFSEGITRNVNRTEYDIYENKTLEGINSINNLQYTIDNNNGFVDVTQFLTSREENIQTTTIHDMRKGNVPFPQSLKRTRKPRMGMSFH